MPTMEILRIELRERGTGTVVDGGTLCVGQSTRAWTIPCEIPLVPGNHRIQVRHPSRAICGVNPREVNVVIPTDPGSAPQLEVIEVEPA